MNPVHPKKLLLTKWTAVRPVARQKHFVVTKVIEPEALEVPTAAAVTEPVNVTRSQLEADVKVARRPRPTTATAKIEWIEIEAVYSGKVSRIAWRELRDTSVWRQGWV
jgi:hypothetical protein